MKIVDIARIGDVDKLKVMAFDIIVQQEALAKSLTALLNRIAELEKSEPENIKPDKKQLEKP